MATISNTPRPGYVFDVTDNVWYPIGTGSHNHSEIPSTIVDAKGDIIAASAADTPARLAVGNNGETLVADSSTATGLRYQPTQAAGKNAIINGGMDIFQRTTSTGFNAYALDRWYIESSANVTTTQSSAKVTPNSQFMMLMTATGTQQIFAYQVVETKNAIYYAGKTATMSAYAAGLTTTTNLIMALQYSTSVDVGMGGSWTDVTVASGNANLTLSSTVTRWSAQYAVPSDAKSLRVIFVNNAANITVGQGIYLGDVQLEVGSVATAFSRAGGTIQGELAACQRYFYAVTADGNNNGAAPITSHGTAVSATVVEASLPIPVTMRTAPSLSVSSAISFRVYDNVNSATVTTAMALGTVASQQNSVIVKATVASGLTQYRPYYVIPASALVSYIYLSAEL